ncbi:potassium-transporting ATPase subunit F [Thiomonas sp.]|uniref:potassium-transporting ATPase subunit F n=1 Tax=Thiomonas sp. TaxID=2047785 RepID=UPI0039B82F97
MGEAGRGRFARRSCAAHAEDAAALPEQDYRQPQVSTALYVLGGVVTVLLFDHLDYALIRAEDF